jgi:hypothetical protein
MKKVFLTALMAIGFGATAQTVTTPLAGNVSAANGKIYMTAANGNINTQGQINVGVGAKTILAANGDIINVGTTQSQNFQTKGGTVFINGSNGNIVTTGVINANGKATIDASNGSIWASGTTTAQGGLKVFNGASITGGLDVQNGKITKVANGTDATDAVNKGQLDAAKTEAITTSNAYTDTKVDALETKVNTEVTRLDGRIDATNQNVTNLSNKVTTEVARVDKRIDATNTTVEANKKEAADATAKVQSNLDKESKRLDMRIDTEIQKVESKFNQRITELDTRLNNRIDNVLTYVGNEFRAINNRIDGLGAMTVALSTAATSSVYNPEKPTNVNFATGYYGRSGALALGISHFLSSNTKLSVNYAAGSFTKSAVGLGIGFCF